MQKVGKRRIWAGLLALAGVLGLGGPARGQVVAATDSAATATAVAAASRAYAQALGTETLLYNGAEYVDYTSPGTRGHQFWESTEPRPGTVDYRDGHFEPVLLRYDIMRDQPVLPYPGQAVSIMLPVGKVAGFTVGERHFVRVVGDSLSQDALSTGFYELLADGPVRLLARHRKTLHQTMILQVLTQEYRQTDELFAQSATGVTEVTSLRRLVAALPAHQNEVQRFARQQKLKFGKDERAASAAQLMRYYYSLRP